MTEKLYDNDAYQKEFTAHIQEIRPSAHPREDGFRYLDIVLNRTLFFPEEGGQSCDRGVLGGAQVVDVQLIGDEIVHTIRCGEDEAAGFVPGLALTGTIDWEHRYDNMQNHSGEHILSGLIHSRFGYDNVGFRLGEEVMTLDLSGMLTRQQVLGIEREANAVVWQNLKIQCGYPDAKTLEGLDYRSKKEVDGPVRIVTIPGVDCCACCAPHVARTGEIGMIKIIHMMKNASRGMRLTAVCGKRALLEMEERQGVLEEVSHLTNKPIQGAADGVQHLLDENKQLAFDMKQLRIRMAKMQMDQIPAGRENVFLFTGPIDDNIVQREMVNHLCDTHRGACGVFSGSDETGWRYIMGRREGDIRTLNQLLKSELNARGGGKRGMVQGSVTAKRAQIEKILDVK